MVPVRSKPLVSWDDGGVSLFGNDMEYADLVEISRKLAVFSNHYGLFKPGNANESRKPFSKHWSRRRSLGMTPRRISSGITLCQRRSVGFLQNPMWSADQYTYHLHSVSTLICPTFPFNLRPTNPPLQPGRQPIPVFPCSIRILSTYYTRFRILSAYYSSIAHILNTYYVGADRYYMHIICVLFRILSAYYLARRGLSRLVSRHGLTCWGCISYGQR